MPAYNLLYTRFSRCSVIYLSFSIIIHRSLHCQLFKQNTVRKFHNHGNSLPFKIDFPPQQISPLEPPPPLADLNLQILFFILDIVLNLRFNKKGRSNTHISNIPKLISYGKYGTYSIFNRRL